MIFTLNGVFASVKSDDTFGIVALAITGANPPMVTPVTPAPVDVEDEENGGDFELLATEDVAGPGNFPMDLAFDTISLLVTGDDQVRVFNATNPGLTTPPTIIDNTGENTISVGASGGFFAIGAEDDIRVYSLVTGNPVLTAQFSFDGINMIIRGVAMTSSSGGRFRALLRGRARAARGALERHSLAPHSAALTMRG